MSEPMDCEALRERLNHDPTRRDVDVDAGFARHAAGCAACRAYERRLLKAESLIGAALGFDVAAVETAAAAPDEYGALPGGGRRTRAAAGRRTALVGGIAASFVALLAVWALFVPGAELSPEQLADAVADHWYHEPESWVETDRPVASALLAEVLGDLAVIDLAGLSTVSFAKSCLVAGRRVPHLVVQGEEGPYMVVLIPGRRLESAVPIELPDEGLSGHIVPSGSGSIAVLGTESAELERIESDLSNAVEWTI